MSCTAKWFQKWEAAYGWAWQPPKGHALTNMYGVLLVLLLVSDLNFGAEPYPAAQMFFGTT